MLQNEKRLRVEVREQRHAAAGHPAEGDAPPVPWEDELQVSKPQGCTCTEIEIPDLQGTFGDEDVYALDMNPDCPVHDMEEVVSLLDSRNRGESSGSK